METTTEIKGLELTLLPVNRLRTELGFSPAEFEKLLLILRIRTEVNGEVLLTPQHMQLLNDLKTKLSDKSPKELIDELQETTYLFKCNNCGELKLSSWLLQDGESLHICSLLRMKELLSSSYTLGGNQPSVLLGRYELIESGSYEQLMLWGHSISLGLDNPLKPGI